MANLVDDTIFSDSSLNNKINEINEDSGDFEKLLKEFKSIHSPKKEQGINKIDIFENLINILYEQISTLKSDVKFLQDESLSKTNIISRLIEVINKNMSIRTSLINGTCTDESSLLSDITNYNWEVSQYNRNISDSNASNYNGYDCDMQVDSNEQNLSILNELNTNYVKVAQDLQKKL